MAPNALRRLTDMGRRNGSDIVLGKVASDFRGVALGLYRVDRDVCTIHDSQIISSLTPHKMFRRSFLAEHGIRFPEGRRRLEDQLFVVQAYFAARVISIVADEICYFYVGRDDGGNAGSNRDVGPDRLLHEPARSPRRRRRQHGAGSEPRPSDGPFLPGPAGRSTCRRPLPDVDSRVPRRGLHQRPRSLIDYVDPSGRRQPGRSDGPPRGVDPSRSSGRSPDPGPAHIRHRGPAARSIRSAGSPVGSRSHSRQSSSIATARPSSSCAARAAPHSIHGLGRDLVAAPIDVTDEIGAVRLITMLRERSSGVEWATTTDFRLEWSEAGSTPEGESASRLRIRATCKVDPAFVAGGGRLSVR